MIDKLLLTLMGLLVVIGVFSFLLFNLVFILQQNEFDAICHLYTLKVDQAGGTTEASERELLENLTARGFGEVEITAPPDAPYGETIQITVSATHKGVEVSPLLKTREVQWHFRYEAGIVCRIYKKTAKARSGRYWLSLLYVFS